MNDRMEGIIDRRILANYQVDPKVMAHLLPPPFEPKLVNGYGIAGMCLIRLSNMRPKGLPAWMGTSAEYGAHRFGVQWRDGDHMKEGVYIPRRDTNSLLSSFAGGRLFPGPLKRSKFIVEEKHHSYYVKFENKDGTSLELMAYDTDTFSDDSVFTTIKDASSFFEEGKIGYSPNLKGDQLDAVQLNAQQWSVSPLYVQYMHSSFFDDRKRFPQGSIKFDHALIMKNIVHEWQSLEELSCKSSHC